MAKGRVGLGRRGEALAADVLQRHSFTIIAQNWYCPEGEVDLIVQRSGEVYFVEVRTRRGMGHSSPEESVTPRKRARMEAVARRYLSAHTPDDDVAWHLSLVAVAMDRSGRLQRITVYVDLDAEPWDMDVD